MNINEIIAEELQVKVWQVEAAVKLKMREIQFLLLPDTENL